MTPERWELISKIFNEATALKVEERRKFVEEACGGDRILMSEINSLLSAHEGAGDFIESPLVENAVGDISEMPTLTGTLIGHYRIDRSIGRGGMGDVYLATDTHLDRCVALKKLPDKCSTDHLLLKRLRNEARAAATLNHPNVATIYSVEEIDDIPFITMEYVDGQTLDAVTPPEGMDIGRFLEIFIQITDALKHAHENGIIHRDIKPGNIMLTPDDTPKILDFGLAQIAEDGHPFGLRNSTITQPGQIIGTPSYMSPEQAQGKEIDHRTDIFSLGVVMYEAITGTRPFKGDNNIELISNLLKTDPLEASQIRPAIPSMISHLLTQCMQKKRSERLQSMDEVRTTLTEAQRTLSSGTSTGSFARRLYRESGSVGVWFRLAPVILVLALATLAWFYFSRPSSDPPISFEKLTMRRLSQSNDVAVASISPDGKSVAYATIDDNGGRSLWIRRTDDSGALQLMPPQPVQYWDEPQFSNDGGQVYFIQADRSATHGTLYRVSSLGGQSRKVIDQVNHLGSLSPDGQRIVFVRYGDTKPNLSAQVANAQLLTAKADDGSDERVIQSVSGDTVFKEPRFSSDGRSIYYVKRELIDAIEYWSIVNLPITGGKEMEILKQKDRIGELALLHDGSGLLFSANDPESNLQQLYRVSLPDGQKSRITNDLNFYYGVSVDSAGQEIVSTQRSDENRIWVGDAVNLATLKPVSKEPTANQNIDWTPDGRIVYDADENNLSHIWISDADGRNAQMLTSNDSVDFEPRVSGDGRYIVFTSRRSGLNQIWRMNIDGTNQVLLADVPGIAESPKFAADGQTVIFRRYLDGSPPLGKISIDGGQVDAPAGIPVSNTYSFAMSPNGLEIAYVISGNGRSKVAIRPVDENQPISTILDFSPTRILKWMPDGKSIYYQERQRGEGIQAKIFQISAASQQPKLFYSAEPESLLDFSFSRDGKKVALIRGRMVANAVLIRTAVDK